ncbi:MAG: CapA family protein [Nitrospinota bacterium]|nr:CapA family protein [Nitrospinota bacterium]
MVQNRKTNPSCSFIACGDVAINRKSGEDTFGKLTRILQNADFTFGNLELPLSKIGKKQPNKICLRGSPSMADTLKNAGFNIMAFANNHALDYGEKAFLETIELMRSKQISIAGAGNNLKKSRDPAIIEKGGIKLGMLCFSSIIPDGFDAKSNRPGINPIRIETKYIFKGGKHEYPGTLPEDKTYTLQKDLERMKKDIQSSKKKVDVVLVNHHWGTSMTHRVKDFEREIAYASIDSGADIVLGGHPHVLQGIEFYKKKPIVYSMGNLIFDFDIPFFTEATKQTFIFGCELNKNGAKNPFLIPCKNSAWEKPKILDPKKGNGRNILQSINQLNLPFSTKTKIKGPIVKLYPGN